MSRRAMSGNRVGGVISEAKRKAPLRKITGVITYAQSLFDINYVELECGHSVHSNGQHRARCVRCSEG